MLENISISICLYAETIYSNNFVPFRCKDVLIIHNLYLTANKCLLLCIEQNKMMDTHAEVDLSPLFLNGMLKYIQSMVLIYENEINNSDINNRYKRSDYYWTAVALLKESRDIMSNWKNKGLKIVKGYDSTKSFVNYENTLIDSYTILAYICSAFCNLDLNVKDYDEFISNVIFETNNNRNNISIFDKVYSNLKAALNYINNIKDPGNKVVKTFYQAAYSAITESLKILDQHKSVFTNENPEILNRENRTLINTIPLKLPEYIEKNNTFIIKENIPSYSSLSSLDSSLNPQELFKERRLYSSYDLNNSINYKNIEQPQNEIKNKYEKVDVIPMQPAPFIPQNLHLPMNVPTTVPSFIPHFSTPISSIDSEPEPIVEDTKMPLPKVEIKPTTELNSNLNKKKVNKCELCGNENIEEIYEIPCNDHTIFCIYCLTNEILTNLGNDSVTKCNKCGYIIQISDIKKIIKDPELQSEIISIYYPKLLKE